MKYTDGRTGKVAKNASVTIMCQFFNYLLIFVNRTIFIRILGVEYLGVNGLFTNILTLLSFAELGVGNAIIFYLYKPLANDDKEEINKLMRLYARIYKIIGSAILCIGLLIIPLLKYVITDTPNIPENLKIIYILFLLDSSISYFFTYKATIINADQKKYIVVLYEQIITVIFTIIKLTVLIMTKNYLLYLSLQILMTLMKNIIISIKADRMYPYIKNSKKSMIEKEKINNIFKDTKALMLYKISDVLINGADNVIISALKGISIVGYSSNYTIITTAASSIFYQLVTSITPSIGNLNANEDNRKSEEIFYKIFFICFWIYSFASSLLIILLDDFIGIWLGKEYIADFMLVIGLVFSFYIKGIQLSTYIYRMTLGLFRQSKYVPIFTAILNVILSVILCKILGAGGVFLATGIAKMLTTGIIDPLLIYKNKFKKSSKKYFDIYVKYAVVFSLVCIITYYISNFIYVSNIVMLIVKFIIASIVFNLIYIIIFRKNNQYIECKHILKRLILNKFVGEKYDRIK